MNRMKPLNDIVFNKLFGDEKSKSLLIGLLNSILNEDIHDIAIQERRIEPETIEGKLSILDIKATGNTGEKFNIEVQLLDEKNMVQRSLYYWAKLFTENFRAGKNYNTLSRTVVINILDFNLNELNGEAFHTRFRLHEVASKTVLTDLMEMHFIECKKFKMIEQDMHNPLHRWLLFLQEDTPNEILKEVLGMDQTLKEAEERLAFLSSDPDVRRQYEDREKALSAERSRMDSAMEHGLAISIKKRLNKGYTIEQIADDEDSTVEELEKILRKFEE